MHTVPVPFGTGQPDSTVGRVREIEIRAGVDRQIIRIHALGDHGFVVVGGKRDDTPTANLTGVECRCARTGGTRIDTVFLLATRFDALPFWGDSIMNTGLRK